MHPESAVTCRYRLRAARAQRGKRGAPPFRSVTYTVPELLEIEMDIRPVIIVCLLLIMFVAALVAVPVNMVARVVGPRRRRRDDSLDG